MIEITPQFDKTLARITEAVIMQAKMRAFVVGDEVEGAELTTAGSLDTTTDVPCSKKSGMYSFENTGQSEELLHYVEEAYPDYRVEVSGHFYYPPGGFMGWHTNSDVPCKHLYITVASAPVMSFFRYRDADGSIVTDFDNQGINFREFDTTNVEPLFWHCVYSQCDRVSFGFRLHRK